MLGAMLSMPFGDRLCSQEELSITIVAGPNAAWAVTKKTGQEAKSGLGFSAGGGADVKIINRLGIEVQAVCSYNKADFKLTTFGGNYFADGNQRIVFVDVPVLLTYKVGSGVPITLKAGGVLSWPIYARTKVTSGQYAYHYSHRNEFFFQSKDHGLALGAQIDISKRLGLDFRFHRGLNSLFRYYGTYNPGKAWRSTASTMIVVRL